MDGAQVASLLIQSASLTLLLHGQVLSLHLASGSESRPELTRLFFSFLLVSLRIAPTLLLGMPVSIRDPGIWAARQSCVCIPTLMRLHRSVLNL